MPRQAGYKVTISGFLPIDKSDLRSQAHALTTLADGSAADIIALLSDINTNAKIGARDIDDEGNAVPAKPRKPRTVKTGTRKAA